MVERKRREDFNGIKSSLKMAPNTQLPASLSLLRPSEALWRSAQEKVAGSGEAKGWSHSSEDASESGRGLQPEG